MLISDKLLTEKRNNDKWISLSERQNNHKYVCPQQHSIKIHEEKMTEIKWEINNSIIIIGDYNTSSQKLIEQLDKNIRKKKRRSEQHY